MSQIVACELARKFLHSQVTTSGILNKLIKYWRNKLFICSCTRPGSSTQKQALLLSN